MSETVKKFMGIELEFLDPTTHGVISWLDFDTGDIVASLGLGSTAKDIGTNDDGEQIGVDNGGSKYLEWNLQGVDYIKITGGGIQFDDQRSLSIDSVRDVITEDEYGNEIATPETYIPSQIQLDSPDFTGIEKANVLYPFIPPVLVDGEYVDQEQTEDYLRLKAIKDEYADNTNALTIEHEHAIVFVNPVTERLLGEIDTLSESFGWYGSFALGDPVEDSMFETKRVDPLKYNLTVNADTDLLPEIGFKVEDEVVWSIEASAENIKFKSGEKEFAIAIDDNDNIVINNANECGFSILSAEDAVSFTDEVYYKEELLDDRFVHISGGDVMTGRHVYKLPNDSIGTGTNTDTLQIYQPTHSADAFMTFHVAGDYAFHFGLDGSTNDLFVGGWSMSANKYDVYNEKTISSKDITVKSMTATNGFIGDLTGSATKLETARTIKLTGDVNDVTQTFDGTADATLSLTIKNDSHLHDTRYYTKAEATNLFGKVKGMISHVYPSIPASTLRNLNANKGDIYASDNDNEAVLYVCVGVDKWARFYTNDVFEV